MQDKDDEARFLALMEQVADLKIKIQEAGNEMGQIPYEVWVYVAADIMASVYHLQRIEGREQSPPYDQFIELVKRGQAQYDQLSNYYGSDNPRRM